MGPLWLLLSIWAVGCCWAQDTTSYQSLALYNVPNCQGTPVSFVASKKPCSGSGACDSFSTVSSQVTCSQGQPTIPAGTVAVKTFSTSGSCQGDPDTIITYPLGVCAVASTAPTYSKVSCASGVLSVTFFNDPICTKATGLAETFGTGCVANGATSVITTCTTLPCFHKDSLVTYKGGEPLTLSQLQAGHQPDCVVPHTVRTDGVKIDTSCSTLPLRLTSDHLVFTTKGITAAGDLKAGDTVYGDEQEQKLCTVTSVQSERAAEDYFGLNCRDSVVMVSGVKTSTFGTYHMLPSLWMKLVSSVLGVQRASRLGDALVTQLRGWNLL